MQIGSPIGQADSSVQLVPFLFFQFIFVFMHTKINQQELELFWNIST